MFYNKARLAPFLQWGWLIGRGFRGILELWVYYIRIRTLRKFKWQMLEIKSSRS